MRSIGTPANSRFEHAGLSAASGCRTLATGEGEEAPIVAAWTFNYLHALRIFTNSTLHEMKKRSFPPDIDEDDVITGMLCLSRVADFWAEYRRERS